MADHCGNCRSTDVSHGLDTFSCLSCGATTHVDGSVGTRGTEVVETRQPTRVVYGTAEAVLDPEAPAE